VGDLFVSHSQLAQLASALALAIGVGGRQSDAEFGGEGGAGFVVEVAQAVLFVDGDDVVVEDSVFDVELAHDFLVGEALQEEVLDGLALELADLARVGGRDDGELEFSGQRLAIGDLLFLAEFAGVGLDLPDFDLQIEGDLGIGPAIAEAVLDFAAQGRLAVELADAGVFALVLERSGFGHFAAEKQAAGEVGDDLIPADIIGVGEKCDVVTFVAGEGGWGSLREIDVAEFELKDGVGEPGIEEGADLDG